MLDSSKNFLHKLLYLFKNKFTKQPNSTKQIKKQFRKKIHQLNLEDRFTQIYKINYWGSNESVSGRGSTLELTSNLRNKLPGLFNKFSIRSVFDGPCGDFNWMNYVVEKADIDYIGGDIVLPLIEANRSKYANNKVKFIKIDLTKDELPSTDLMICRDCLFHLSYEDTKLVLNNFVRSNISYLLTTTYENNNSFKNKDIITGHFRSIDLFSPPYNFPKEILFKIDDWVAPEDPRFMCLWSREQVIEALNVM
jgi:hypothetical protein